MDLLINTIICFAHIRHSVNTYVDKKGEKQAKVFNITVIFKNTYKQKKPSI